jgi:SAM-dependent methyltransferase
VAAAAGAPRQNEAVNKEAWDRLAARRGDATPVGAVQYGQDLPSETDLRLIGDVRGKRVLDLGCGGGENAVAFAKQGAHTIALDTSHGQLSLARSLAETEEIRVEWHESDAADLAFMRADSIDVALSVGLLSEVEDIDRLFRQVHRVLRHGSPFVFAYEHPLALCVGREGGEPGGLPFGRLEMRRSYYDTGPIEQVRDGEKLTVWPRTIADVFAALHRAGYRVDALIEPQPTRSADPGPLLPGSIVWRARKEGV